jgi:hypothetical protein
MHLLEFGIIAEKQKQIAACLVRRGLAMVYYVL